MKISGWIKTRVCDTFTIGCMDFYIMMHDCGEVLLCEAGGRSCRLDAAAIGIPKAESYMAVLKHRWEEKISLASLSPDELLQLSEHTGIRFNSPTAPTPNSATNPAECHVYRAIMAWAIRHPRLAKMNPYFMDYLDGLHIRPLSNEEYSGF